MNNKTAKAETPSSISIILQISDTKAEFSNCYFYRTSKQIADFSYTQNPARRVIDIKSLESKQSTLF